MSAPDVRGAGGRGDDPGGGASGTPPAAHGGPRSRVPASTAPRARSGDLRALRRAAARAAGCPATAPSAVALGLGWRLRADALFLAAAHAASYTVAGDGRRGVEGVRLRRLAQAWAAGAARLAGADADGAPTTRWLAWADAYFARSAELPETGGAWALMRAELAVWRLARALRPPSAGNP